jgi:eukaryotic-like serine/threonine-protein kinase
MLDQFQRLNAALAGRYAIERELGRGGTATVYLAEDLKHRRHVALKVLHPEVASGIGTSRFLREISIAARLNHPHILALYDSGEVDGFVLYAMPYVKGESLRQRIQRETQLPIDQAVAITRDVASALEYAHSQRIVHRDIKPENILLYEGSAMVADFGIALAFTAAAGSGDRTTEAGIVIGTPEYMSPEQSTSEPLDARSDVYSLGCVLYEMLTGEPPFNGPTAMAVVAKRLATEAPSVHRLRPAVTPGVERALGQALARVPADRFPSAAAFAEALGTSASLSPGAAIGL